MIIREATIFHGHRAVDLMTARMRRLLLAMMSGVRFDEVRLRLGKAFHLVFLHKGAGKEWASLPPLKTSEESF